MNLSQLVVPTVVGLLVSVQAQAYYCSTAGGNGYINVGDPMSQVQQTCGQPTSTNESEKRQDTTTAIQYWTYENAKIMDGTGLGTKQQTVERSGPSTTVEITEGKITNIMQGQGGGSDCLAQSNIQVGNTSDKLLGKCGSPSSTTTQPKVTEGLSQKIITWTYDQGEYASPLVLTFENGSLTQIQD